MPTDFSDDSLKIIKALLVYSQHQNLPFEQVIDEFYPYIFEHKNLKLNNNFQTFLVHDKNIFKKYLDKQIQLGNRLLKIIQKNNVSNPNSFAYINWNDYNVELLKRSFNFPNNEYLTEYKKIDDPSAIGSESEKTMLFLSMLKDKINYIKRLNYKIDLLTIPENNILKKIPIGQDIFIVHSHANELRINLLRLLEKLGLNPVIINEKANAGKTVIEKFEKYSNVSFAIILLTKDDVGGKDERKLNPRADQNVIFEHGFFIGRVGRERVLALIEENIEIPSDLNGITFIIVDSSERWKFDLVKEMKSIGYNLDSNLIL